MYCPTCRGEFREGFTWCRDCETDLVAVLPEERREVEEPRPEEPQELVDWPERGEEEPASDAAAADSEPDPERSRRAVDLLVVLFVAFSTPLFISTYDWWTGNRTGGGSISLYTSLSRIVRAASAITLLWYVLSRQGRTLRQLGLTAERADVLPTLLLTLLIFVPNIVSRGLYGFPLLDGAEADPWTALSGIPSLGLLTVVSQLANAAYEELIVRAFLITEVVELTGQVPLAVLSSVCLQALYHLYQGGAGALVNAGGFLILSIYYVRYRRITPVLLAHFFYNLTLYGYGAATGR
jgi:membrane protease YdiL (CAAX protease family)